MTSNEAASGSDKWYVERIRAQWEADPNSVDSSWRAIFESETRPPQIRTQTPPPPPAPLDTPAVQTSSAGSVPEPVAKPQAHAYGPAATSPHVHPMMNFAPPKAIITAEELIDAQEVGDATSLLSVESVTRSDLPPAPRSCVAEATSPYTRQHHGHSAAALNAQGLTEDTTVALKGIARATAANMDASLSVPTATSQRDIPAKFLIENRGLINSHLARTIGGKISFTHLIGYAVLRPWWKCRR